MITEKDLYFETTFDELGLRKLEPRTRLSVIKDMFMTDTPPPASARWDYVFLMGEVGDELIDDEQVQREIADFMVWILQHDVNQIVEHEAAFQLGIRRMEHTYPALIKTAMDTTKGELARHEAIEALGILRIHDCRPILVTLAADETEPDTIRDTARVMVERLDRLKKAGK